MKSNIITGIGLGTVAGIIDVIPMIIQNLIGWKEPVSLVPIIIMTSISGGTLGYSIHRFRK